MITTTEKDILFVIDAQVDFITGVLANLDPVYREYIINTTIPNLVKLIKQHPGQVIATHDTHFTKLQVSSAWPPEPGVAYEDSLENKYLPVPHCIKLTEGWELVPEVLAACQEKNKGNAIKFRAVDKYTFGYTKWADFLDFKDYKDFDRIIIAGYCTDICVISNALILRALFPNKEIIIVENCCAGVTPEKHNAAIEVMKSCQILVETV